MQGFKAHEQQWHRPDLVGARRARTIALEVGGIAETISVQAETLRVQTTTGERSATITASAD